MPIYEYECSDCGQIEEAVQKISDAPLTDCPHCSGRLHKIISQSAFHLKGGGWYADLYSSSKPDGGKPEKAAAKSDGGGGGDASGGAKSATKKDSGD